MNIHDYGPSASDGRLGKLGSFNNRRQIPGLLSYPTFSCEWLQDKACAIDGSIRVGVARFRYHSMPSIRNKRPEEIR